MLQPTDPSLADYEQLTRCLEGGSNPRRSSYGLGGPDHSNGEVLPGKTTRSPGEVENLSESFPSHRKR